MRSIRLIIQSASYEGMLEGKRTDLRVVVIGAIQEECRKAVSQGDRVECHDNPPVGDHRRYPIEHLLEEEQEAKLNGDNGTPSKRLIDRNPLEIFIHGSEKSRVLRQFLDGEADT